MRPTLPEVLPAFSCEVRPHLKDFLDVAEPNIIRECRGSRRNNLKKWEWKVRLLLRQGEIRADDDAIAVVHTDNEVVYKGGFVNDKKSKSY